MATAVAAILARARREVDELFFDREAFSPGRAVEFEPRMRVQQRYLEQLMAEGVVHEVQPGRYWFDLPAYKERRRRQFVWTMWIIALGAVVVLIVWMVEALSR